MHTMESVRIKVPFAADPTSPWDSNRRRKRLKVAASSVRSLVESHKFGGPPTVMTWTMYMCAWLCVCANIYIYIYIYIIYILYIIYIIYIVYIYMICVYICVYMCICIQYPLSFIYWIYWLIWLLKLGFDVCAFICVHSKIDVNFTSNMMSDGADASCPQVSGDGFLHKPRPIFQVLARIIVTTATTQNHPASGYVGPSNTLKKDEPITISS